MFDESKANRIGLGTVQFGLNYGVSNKLGKTPSEEAFDILKTACDKGINLLDTAFQYGDSESVLGECLAGFKEDFNVVSKYPDDKDDRVGHYLTQSLHKLRRDHIYGYLLHNADNLNHSDTIWDSMLAEKTAGRVKKIGVSVYYPYQLEVLISRGVIPDLVQVPYNVFDTRFEASFSYLKELGIEVHTRSAFLQGLFFVAPEALPDYFDPIKRMIGEIRLKFENDNNLLAAALVSFCLANEFVDKVLIGVNNREQLAQMLDNLETKHVQLTARYQGINEDILLPFNWPK